MEYFLSLNEVDIKIDFTNPQLWSENGMGRCSIKESLIEIDTKMKEDVQMQTLMHELIHYILDTNFINSETPTETLVSILGIQIYSLLANTKNNWFLKKYIDMGDKG